jgi:glycosyltransferase involved in cell wall biosynthesis
MKSLVSVILAVYNGEKYLQESIETVFAQTYSPIELILINDGSQDRTEQIAQTYGSKIRYFYQPNRGQPAAANWGIRMALGSYIAFLDADDLYLPDKTALQVEVLTARPQVDFVFGHVEQFFSPELSLEMKEKLVCPTGTQPGYLAAAGLFRKECFERVGLFNEKQRMGVFIEWYMRSTEAGLKNALIPNQVMRRRIHGNNMAISSENSRLEYVQIVKAALKRRLIC